PGAIGAVRVDEPAVAATEGDHVPADAGEPVARVLVDARLRGRDEPEPGADRVVEPHAAAGAVDPPLDEELARARRSREHDAVASSFKHSIASPGSAMNSQRRRPGPPDTTVVGRAGSQIWTFSGSNDRDSLKTTSTTNQS